MDQQVWKNPSGSDISAYFRCTFTMADATTLTEAGYVGRMLKISFLSCYSKQTTMLKKLKEELFI